MISCITHAMESRGSGDCGFRIFRPFRALLGTLVIHRALPCADYLAPLGLGEWELVMYVEPMGG